jgi:hypothetical protein
MISASFVVFAVVVVVVVVVDDDVAVAENSCLNRLSRLWSMDTVA